jgi:hypothetical protein
MTVGVVAAAPVVVGLAVVKVVVERAMEMVGAAKGAPREVAAMVAERAVVGPAACKL